MKWCIIFFLKAIPMPKNTNAYASLKKQNYPAAERNIILKKAVYVG